jgi:hypothetical protein
LIIWTIMAYDIFFLSYNETNADTNWSHLQHISPTARRVDGIVGLHAAHQECAKRSFTSHFFVVDADNIITDPNVFAYKIPSYDTQYVHLWYALNPVNDLEYGWGGLKLFPKSVFSTMNTQSLDMTTSFDLKIIPTVASTTAFNSTPYDTWRSAFREAVKLTTGIINQPNYPDNQIRLDAWKTASPSAMNAKWSIRGAYDGEAYAHATNDLPAINNWSWLKHEFNLRYGDVTTI